MREKFSVIFVVMIIALAVCSFIAFRSRKINSISVALLTGAFIPPVIGNLILVCSGDKALSLLGEYIYFIGMDIVMFALLRFAIEYCNIRLKRPWLKNAVYLLLIADIMQFLVNPVTGHAFDNEAIEVDGFPYYRLVPYVGQAMHRILDYSILAAVIVIFLIKAVRTSRFYSERYYAILITLIIAALWQTIYIFSRTPIDRSMVGFGVFGMLVFYFALYYRPMKLLDCMLAGIASEMSESLFFFDANGRCIWANEAGAKLAGIEGEDFEGVPKLLKDRFGEEYQSQEEYISNFVLGTGDDIKYYLLEKHSLLDEKKRLAGSFMSIRDNTEDQQKLKRKMFNSTHDSLTGLYTREYLYERIHEVLTARQNTEYFVIYIDVRNFKIINDIFSNEFGDKALQDIAEWIKSWMSDECVFGRLVGASFGVCIPVEEFEPASIEEKLSPFVVDNGTLGYHILIHLGVYKAIEPDMEVSLMFDRANLALSTIKDEYQTHIAYYNDEIRSKVLWDQHISAQLHTAIAERQLKPYLQPIVDRNGAIVGAEALVRWIHPTDGFLSPGAFIPVFEKNGMIVEVDKYMWRCACEILASWKEKHGDIFISVNISPKDFYFVNVVEEIKKLTAEYGVSPSQLRIEITETVMMTEAEIRMKTLNEFRKMGYIVEMDDFGSGYSSLNMLKDMPVDVLKIDMKFLSKSRDDGKAQTILQNIINLSDDLGIDSLTEGVETEAQFKMLNEMGCKLFQGYYFAKPMPLEEFEDKCL
ncbi:MAG: EAL domain-containing protein [Ruminococcus sp.]|uniref:putative bifunctional diguanylate cyclase/phosphodiesterase n=1 Tax=Ruminococcus sp. TaxID=41978 RepID=UPI0025CF644D|nr:EAL domain-containing protein [Ruminococcus sp.]MBR5681788.1 EAL domain-containing protein [Ruminococcus sp.]